MIIETENLVKAYQNKVAVNSINLSVEKGQIYGFLGPNGAGKSTTIKMLTGLVFPSSGKGQVLDRPLGDVQARAKLGYLPEHFRYQEWMTGEDLLNFHTSLYRLKRDPERNRNVLRRVGLLEQGNYKVGGYSKGMQQRIGLACALLPGPDLLFLDEPTSALDPIGRKDVRDIILDLQKEGTTIFLNSHLLSEVEAVCDHIAIINKGVIVKSGSMKDLLMGKVTLSIRCSPITEDIYHRIKERFDSTAAPQLEDGSIFMTLKTREEIPEIAALLTAGGIKLYELTPQHETLESVFLKVVGEEETS
ncbi:ABC transporter ATP-binding protein [Papillibacter cinnamivorans]|uniref:ABC-2 type transport system ATP-binding protein n=1 Tax=Papillibacter cinnamivorans DSM 12816 TaxID=1122930 RepID=A0A1W2CP92_9FIRM|nr:ABC transporter ATP-binding protein [Papillibacter cinnamivorans]SMC86836.1 ABC-2 type transport system ATP-binding protein [Papillibacter cinnamivorans DSM 12816]